MILLDLSIKATVLIAIGFALAFTLRQASAASRHTVWTTVFVALLLLPVARIVMPAWAVIAVPDRFSHVGAAPLEPDVRATEGAAAGATAISAGLLPGEWPGWWASTAGLVSVWAIGAVVCVMWIGAGLVGTRRLERVARFVDDERIRARAARATDLLGVRRPVRLLTVSKQVMPGTWGVMAPRVLLPKESRGWSDARLDAVLTHELSHVVRGDAASHLAARLATAMWWWHPLVWVAARYARFERERACDDLVLTQGTCATDYAADLVTFVSWRQSTAGQSPAMLAMARRSQLEGRVMAILKSDVNRRGVSQAGFMAALLVMGLVWPLAAARPAVPAQDPAQAPVRVGGSMQAPKKIRDVRPVYPESAKAEGRQGIAIIEAVIGADGTVTDAKVIRSIGTDLDMAALDAVLQWAFTPTTLNGRAVPVIMTVTVNFTLSDGVPPPPPPPPPVPPAPRTPVAGEAPPPPPPPPAPPVPPSPWTSATGQQPVRVGGNIQAPTKTKDVRPIYPQDAREARKSGIVILEILVDADGKVSDARVIRSVDMLEDAARDAVMQWEFTPTLLNGRAVPVIMTVTVNFTLQ